MNELIEKYILGKQHAWAATTLEKERSRLRAHVVNIRTEPKVIFEKLSKSMKPYTIKTTFIRLGEFYQWLMEQGHIPVAINPFKKFMRDYARLFKYSYQPERLDVTYEEAKEKIQTIADVELRNGAQLMLETGVRSCELETFDGDKVIGKGGKPRTVYPSPELRTFRFTGDYFDLYRALKKLGLKPHTLRKLCATKLSRQEGVTLIDTMEAMGWNSMETPAKYLQPLRKEHLGILFQQFQDETPFKSKKVRSK